MPTQMEIEPIARQLPVRQSTPMELLNVALQNNAAIDVIERLAALQERFMARDAEVQFNMAMNAAQSEITRIAPNETNKQTNSKWATYDKLDRVLRPIYIKHGFSLSFDSGECPEPDSVVAYCYVSHQAGHTRKYQSPPMPKPIKGPQGKDVMTATHGTGAAMSYAMRYLLKYIFNIAIGEDDTDGNSPHSTFRIEDYDELQERIAHFDKLLDDKAALEEHWRNSRAWAKSKKDQDAVDRIDAKKDECKAKMKAGAK